ncbi:hypothetical protein, partial [Mycobacterium avium]
SYTTPRDVTQAPFDAVVESRLRGRRRLRGRCRLYGRQHGLTPSSGVGRVVRAVERYARAASGDRF